MLFRSHAGGKFGGGAYKVSGGLHGVGASVVNALSEELQVEIHQGGALYTQTYHRGAPAGGLVKGKQKVDDSGTIVRFLPDHTMFETLDYDFEILSQRFREMAYLTKGVFIRFTDLRGDGNEASYYFDSGIEAFVRQISRSRQPLHPDPIYVTLETEEAAVEVEIGKAHV